MKKTLPRRPVTQDAYAEAGVNLDVGDAFSKFAGQVSRATWGNSPYVEILDYSHGHFRGPRGYRFKGLPEGTFEVGSSDGIGTKTILLAAAHALRNAPQPSAAHNLVAMTAGDTTRWGGLPLMHLNNLEVKTLGDADSETFQYYREEMGAFGRCVTEQDQILLGGETAEMSDCVSTEITASKIAFNWSDAVIGVNHPDKLIDGSKLKAGQFAIVLRDGLRSNGASAIRKYMRHAYGDSWWSNPEAEGDIREASKPAVLYDKFLATMNGWYANDFQPIVQATAIAHLSGGGIEDKFGPLIAPSGLSVDLDNLYDPPVIVRKAVAWKMTPDAKAYRTFNGGQGALVVVREADVQRFCIAAHGFGIQARPAGPIFKAKGRQRIRIRSKFTDDTFCINL
jgi:phosphoribosylformylglycinamidine cyclo-ligase